MPFAAPGDRILIARDRNRPDEGRLARLVEAGPTRAAAPCPHFGPAFGPDGRVDLAAGACGGCQVQHLSARAYRSWKAGLLENALARAGLTPETVETLITVHNLACVYRDTGRFDEAQQGFERVQRFCEDKFRPEHAFSLANLDEHAKLLRKTGDDAEAALLEARAKAIREKQQPSDKPDKAAEWRAKLPEKATE